MTINNKILHVTSLFTKAAQEDDSLDSVFIEGYANVATPDRGGDVIPATAWEDGMDNFLKNPIMLAYHDHKKPIGKMVDHKIDTNGLWIRASISAAAGEVYKLIKSGVLTTFSVGFLVKDAKYDSGLDLFIIKALELLEISVVSVPMNQDSTFALAKSFDTSEDYLTFKKQFAPDSTLDNSQEGNVVDNPNNVEQKGILNMDENKIAEMIAEATAKAVAAAEDKRLEAEKAAIAKADAEKALEAKIVKAVASKVSSGETGAEKLMADIEKRLADSEASHKSALDGLHATIAEKAAEIEAMQKSKMAFGDKGAKDVDYAEKEKAVLLSVMMNRKGVDSTKFGRQLIEKLGPHSASATWETEVSFNMEAEIRKRLVVAPTIRAISMQTNVMKIPLNPDTGVGTWVTNAQFGTSASAGTTQTHQLSEITLSAYKVATNEYMNFEEEEDSLIVLTPIIRDAMIRRVARAVDIAYLRGAGAGADPVKGLATYATANTTNPVGTKVTVAQLRDMRKNLAWYGLDPAEVTYVVSPDVYYDLLEDTAFQSMNQVGVQATLLTGQIGQIGNSPVLISGEFAAKAVGAIGAIAYNTANFLAGNQRGLRFDTQDLVETQRRVLVSSLRTGLTQLTTNNGQGVSKLTWAA